MPMPHIDMTGEKFGRLFVLEIMPPEGHLKSGHMRPRKWLCVCDCGELTEVRGVALRYGTINSCGCLRRENHGGGNGGGAAHKADDLTGMRFGRLVAIKPNGVSNTGKTRWLCKCDCGKEASPRVNDIRYGNTKSCGCQKNAKRSGAA